jgi:hypothetical protein
MSIASAAPKYPHRSHIRNSGNNAFSFVGANGTNPNAALTLDPAALVSTIVRDGEGSYVVTLKVGFYGLQAFVNVQSTDVNHTAKVDAVTPGGAGNAVIYVTCFNGGAVDDLDGVRIDVFYGFGV